MVKKTKNTPTLPVSITDQATLFKSGRLVIAILLPLLLVVVLYSSSYGRPFSPGQTSIPAGNSGVLPITSNPSQPAISPGSSTPALNGSQSSNGVNNAYNPGEATTVPLQTNSANGQANTSTLQAGPTPANVDPSQF